MSQQETRGSTAGCRLRRVPQRNFKADIPAAAKEQIKQLHRDRDNWHGLVFLALDWLVVAAAVAATIWSGFHLAVYLVAVVVIGSRQRALRSLLHEASHHKLVPNKRANLWVGRLLVAFPLLEGVSGYLCAHCEHHRHLWDTELDPKRRQYAALGIIRPRDPLRFTLRHLLRPLTLVHAPYNVLAALVGRDENRRETWIRLTYLATLTAVAFATGWAAEAALLWLVPYCTTYQIFRYWSDIADHAGLEISDPWQATRSWTAPWLLRQLIAPHNANWHLGHHLYPSVPQHQLPRLDRILGAVPEYRDGHHCHGFVLPTRADRPSVVQDLLRPEKMAGYHNREVRNDSRGVVLRALLGRPQSSTAAPSCADTCPLGTLGDLTSEGAR
ncbi:fatty acid desaturase [Actinophytocola sp.]|uniref:fatty acid desaturase n=1 Tax=Actinophytocola sp. TaxID=1872138 RepID=UPI002ED4BD7F